MRSLCLFLQPKGIWGCSAVALLALLAGPAYGAANVTATTLTLQADFIASTTNQYDATITPSPYFANTYSISIKGKKDYTPPVVSSPILTGTAFRECFVHGFVFGMESERKDDLRIIDSLRSDILTTDTCGGFVAGSSVTASAAFLDGCWTAYSVANSTITQRDGMTPVIVP